MVPGERAPIWLLIQPPSVRGWSPHARRSRARSKCRQRNRRQLRISDLGGEDRINLNPKAQASTSSARGLYQFIEQTWLGTVKEAGNAFGYGKYADAITKSDSGRYSVADSSDSRRNPQAA
jgi:hypothetical protein